jgi:hypothetical protein
LTSQMRRPACDTSTGHTRAGAVATGSRVLVAC